MHMNVEIEFKTRISKDKYETLLEAFSLDGNIFKQTNFYFDTHDLDLNRQAYVLRIRQKKDIYKLTLKSQSEHGAFEYHVILSEAQVADMKANGFRTKDFFDLIDYTVYWQVTLDNFRASTPYEGGTLFLDYCEYCGLTDYEVEFEADHFETGLMVWNKFLSRFNISFQQTLRKSERALNCVIPK